MEDRNYMLEQNENDSLLGAVRRIENKQQRKYLLTPTKIFLCTLLFLSACLVMIVYSQEYGLYHNIEVPSALNQKIVSKCEAVFSRDQYLNAWTSPGCVNVYVNNGDKDDDLSSVSVFTYCSCRVFDEVDINTTSLGPIFAISTGANTNVAIDDGKKFSYVIGDSKMIDLRNVLMGQTNRVWKGNVNQIDLQSWVICSEVPSDCFTKSPTVIPTLSPTLHPTRAPTHEPTRKPTFKPTLEPTKRPTAEPTAEPTAAPSADDDDDDDDSIGTPEPTKKPTSNPTAEPTIKPTAKPTTLIPTFVPTVWPSWKPTG